MGQIAQIAGNVAVRVALQVAVVAASVALQLALRPKPPNVDSPRIGDLGVSASTYGVPIPPKGYGRFRLGTNMIWATDIVEVASKRKQGGGKGGGGGGSVTIYNYFGNAAFAVGIGPAGSIRRIWADSKVIWDVAATGASRVFKYDDVAKIRVYTGTSDQDPDELIESVEGAGNVPGFRGLIYFVLENLPLEDFGNRTPQIQVEVEYETASEPSNVTITNSDGRAAQSVTGLLNLQSLYAIEPSQNSIHRIDLITEDLIERIVVDGSNTIYAGFPGIAGGLRASMVHGGPDGRLFVYGKERTSPQNLKLVAINPYNLKPISVGTATRPSPSTTSRDATATWVLPSPVGLKNYTLIFEDGSDGGSAFGPSNLFLWDRDGETSDGAPAVKSGLALDGAGTMGDRTHLIHMAVDSDGVVWAIGIKDNDPDANGREARLFKITVEVNVSDTSTVEQILGAVTGSDILVQLFFQLLPDETVEMRVAEEFDLRGFGLDFVRPILAETNNIGGAIVYDPVSDRLVIFGDPDDNGDYAWIVWDPATETAAVTRTFNTGTDPNTIIDWKGEEQRRSLEQGPFNGTVLAYTTVNTVLRINVDTLDIEETITPPVNVSALFFDNRLNSVIYWPFSAGNDAQRQFFNKNVATPPTLEEVVTGICGEVGLAPADLDFDSGFSGKTIDGYAFTGQKNARSILDPLLFAFTFDGVESDFQLKFVTRGVPTPVAIPESALQARIGLPNPDDDRVLEMRNQEIEVPEELSIRHVDAERDFQEGTQTVRRHRVPNPTQFSETPLAVEVPVAIDASVIRNAGNVRLYNAWVERTQFELALGPSFLRLDPTDLIDVTKGNVVLGMRIGQADLGTGLVSKLGALGDDVDTYTQDAPPAIVDVPSQEVGLPGPTELILMDTPFMRDADGLGDFTAGIYAAFGANTQFWRGASLLISRDGGASYESLGAAKDSATWGFLDEDVAALPLEASGASININDGRFSNLITAWDRTTEIEVFVVDGDANLTSVTELQVLNGANFAALVKTNGDTEIFQFATVTDLGDSRFRLSTLLRGRRGTELQAVAGHLAGERFVLLTADTVSLPVLPLEDLTKQFFWRALSLGEKLAPSGGQVVRLRGNNLRPLAVVNPEADLDPGTPRSGSDIIVTWTRRTRFGGRVDFLDGVANVPLGEGSEEYEVELLDPTATTVQQTFTGLTSEAVTITAAERTTAGYADTDAVNLVIYQLNGIIGRGFALPVLI